jgi:hypothetical protein
MTCARQPTELANRHLHDVTLSVSLFVEPLMHQPHFTPHQGDPGGNQGQGGGFNGSPHHTPPSQVPTGGGNGPPFPPHSGSGGAPPPQGPSSSGSVASSASGPNRKKCFTCKPDIAAYKEYKAEAGYSAWIEDTVVVMRA